MLQPLFGAGVDAAQSAGDSAVHQLKLWFGLEHFRVERQDPPWRVLRAFPLEGQGRLVHLNNVSGGVLAGDRLALDVHVEAGAAAQITTTGATRLYRHRPGANGSEQQTSFRVGDGARLEYLPDPLIPYAGSRHAQTTVFRLGRGATLLWWETLAPGRLAHGERFAFERLRVETEVYVGPRPILKERFLLEPARQHLASAVRMSHYSHMTSLCVVQEGRSAAFWRGVEEELMEIARARTSTAESVWGASALVSDGVIVRGLAVNGRIASEGLVAFWKAARFAVTGLESVLPRKVY